MTTDESSHLFDMINDQQTNSHDKEDMSGCLTRHEEDTWILLYRRLEEGSRRRKAASYEVGMYAQQQARAEFQDQPMRESRRGRILAIEEVNE